MNRADQDKTGEIESPERNLCVEKCFNKLSPEMDRWVDSSAKELVMDHLKVWNGQPLATDEIIQIWSKVKISSITARHQCTQKDYDSG